MNAQQLTGQVDDHIVYLTDEYASFGIHRDMQQDWLAMQAAAQLDNISLTIASGFRNFDRQLNIWNRKFTGELAVKDFNNHVLDTTAMSEADIVQAILLYSALPGASRHHWGCDIDVFDSNALPADQLTLSPWEYAENGPFSALTLWLKKHSSTFGFYFPYDEFRGGIAAEPWHLSYAPLSQHCQKDFTVEHIQQALADKDIQGKGTLISMLPEIFTRYITNVGMPS